MATTELINRLRTHVETVAASPRTPETAEHQAARNYIENHLRQCGFSVELKTYDAEGVECINIVTEPMPNDEKLPLFIVGAHYDTKPGSPGADDNASAVAGLLELAKWLQPQLSASDSWKARLQLVAYDQEEYGLIGSNFQAVEIKKAGINLLGMISLEMLGYIDDRPGSQQLPPEVAHLYPDVGNFIGVVGNQNSTALLQSTVAAMKQVEDLPVEFISIPNDGHPLPATRLSDHASFWDAGFPALMITDTSFYRNPHYHQTTDTPETLNYSFLAKVTEAVCLAVQQLLQS